MTAPSDQLFMTFPQRLPVHMRTLICRPVILIIPICFCFLCFHFRGLLFEILQRLRPCLETAVWLVDVVQLLPVLACDHYGKLHHSLAVPHLQSYRQTMCKQCHPELWTEEKYCCISIPQISDF